VLTTKLVILPLPFSISISFSFSISLIACSVNFKKNEKEYQADRSEVLKFLREEETGQSTPGNEPNYELARLLLILNEGVNPFVSDNLAD